MGRFQNTQYVDTVNNITDAMVSFLDNPYYNNIDKHPWTCDYLHINKNLTTLDEGSQQEYAFKGQNSPIRYDLIKNFVLFGPGNRIETNLNREEFGVSGDIIEGEFYVLPDTIIPYPGDVFRLYNIKQDYCLFKVTAVNRDTLKNNKNFYRINYKLETTQESRYQEIRTRIVNNYTFIMDNLDTEYSMIMQDDAYNAINELDNLSIKLKDYFQALFYSSRVQTFIYKYINDNPLYDFFMIEFIKKNNILKYASDYIHVCHQMRPPSKFPIVYNNTFFRCLELKDLEHIRKYTYRGFPIHIDDSRSIFVTRQEEYYYVCYDCYEAQKCTIPSFRDDLIYNIENNIKYTECKYTIFNIVIKYFNNEEITKEDIEAFDCIGWDACIELFYGIPIIIFCIEKYIDDKAKNKEECKCMNFDLSKKCIKDQDQYTIKA